MILRSFSNATRKTHWGLLDERAVHLGGGGTHRLGLGDAIMIKNNHLQLLAPTESGAIPIALEPAWKRCQGAAFVEVEVRSKEAAQVAQISNVPFEARYTLPPIEEVRGLPHQLDRRRPRTYSARQESFAKDGL
ncbi:MAG: hypothetical protein HY237_07045 [Acidobacteria bacterium]|nr:hypothetical protein [Acidobacteriota bacterium]